MPPRRSSLRFLSHRACLVVSLAIAAWAGGVQAQNALPPGMSGPIMPTAESTDAMSGGPLRLRQPFSSPIVGAVRERPPAATDGGVIVAPAAAPTEPYAPGEFEQFVSARTGADAVRRLGASLLAGNEAQLADLSPLVPADYLVAPGDEILITLWGSVDADLRLFVDRGGRINVPRVGAIQVSGVRHADLAEVVNRRIAQVFRNFQSSVSLGQLRGIRVFLTGFVERPGAHTVSSLSTMVAALMRAGGPSAAGTFRNVELRRGGLLVTTLDLYDLIVRGNRSGDMLLQAGDVVHVSAVGPQVALIGSVNKPAVLELKPGETVADALLMVGGFTAVADRNRLAIERLEDRLAGRIENLSLPADASAPLANGSLLRAFSQVAAALPSQFQNKRVKVEGEVLRPAEYLLPQNSTVRDAIQAAGGYTPAAYVHAAELIRESVRRMQQQNYERALSDLETDLARANSSQRVSSAEDAGAQGARNAATSRLIDRLRAVRPSGRIVLQLPPDATDLPDGLLAEDGDRIHVPARPNSVGVFGSVFNGAAYLYQPGRTIGDYLRFAGGPTRGADEGSIFVVRASGNVVSNRQRAGWFNNGKIQDLGAEPGDTVFVPEEMDKTTLVQGFKDWTQILFQFGLGIAGIVSATR